MWEPGGHEEILAQRGQSKYDEYPKTKHIVSAGKACGNCDNITWLFKQDRGDRASEDAPVKIGNR